MSGSFPIVAQQLREAFQRAVAAALEEDLDERGLDADVTTWPIVPERIWGHAQVVAEEGGVVCGIQALDATYAQLDDRVSVTFECKDGDELADGGVIATVEGPARAILVGERSALNILAHLSGIATTVRTFLRETPATELTDTRKTLPGLRSLQKYAVRVGGGTNHRFGLWDGILIKDNHIVASGGIGEAVRRARAASALPVQVECTTLAEVDEALDAGAAAILLDNRTPDELRELAAHIRSRLDHVLIEASGGVTLGNLFAVASSGVDRVSVGAFTHSPRALDVSMELVRVWEQD